jgi:hypothetical protein
VLSLICCIATVGLWVRSYRHPDVAILKWARFGENKAVTLTSFHGTFWFTRFTTKEMPTEIELSYSRRLVFYLVAYAAAGEPRLGFAARYGVASSFSRGHTGSCRSFWRSPQRTGCSARVVGPIVGGSSGCASSAGTTSAPRRGGVPNAGVP